MKKTSFLLLSCLLLFSCGSSGDKRLIARIDDYYSNSKSGTYPASKAFTSPMRYAVGQFVITGTTDNDGNRTINRISICGKSGRGWIFEFYTLTRNSENVMQICMTGVEKASKTGNLDLLGILWIKTIDSSGKVQKIEGPALTMMKAEYKKAAASLIVSTSGIQNGGTVQVPAGVFKSTKTVKGECSFLGKTYKSTIWYHSSVPVTGMVKAVTNDKKYVTELIGFGLKGAGSFFR